MAPWNWRCEEMAGRMLGANWNRFRYKRGAIEGQLLPERRLEQRKREDRKVIGDTCPQSSKSLKHLLGGSYAQGDECTHHVIDFKVGIVGSLRGAEPW